MNQEDEFLFQDEDDTFAVADEIKEQSLQEVWEMLVVDDEIDVHQITRVVLDGFTYENKNLVILNAYSAEQAKQLLIQHHDIAVIFLDVVMETNDAGLKLVEYIRETLGNRFARIVLRTGQPGYAPEKEVIRKYEINDYANKAELTAQKLFTMVTANLRAYSHIKIIESHRQHLEAKVTERTYEVQEKNKQLVQLNRELQAKNKILFKLNQEKNEFLGIAAHNLKNPLSAVQGLAEMIESDFDELSKGEIIEFVGMIQISIKQMFKLVTNLLDVNAIESGRMNISLSAVDISSIVQSLVKNYHERAKAKNITLLAQNADSPCYVLADINALPQVLDNLISNAIKYSLHYRNVTVRIYYSGECVRCEIQDEGPGLSDKDQQMLFGKFIRLTARPTGGEHSTGLGLFIVKRLIEAMNGKVWCESKLGVGSTFVVELPISS